MQRVLGVNSLQKGEFREAEPSNRKTPISIFTIEKIKTDLYSSEGLFSIGFLPWVVFFCRAFHNYLLTYRLLNKSNCGATNGAADDAKKTSLILML